MKNIKFLLVGLVCLFSYLTIVQAASETELSNAAAELPKDEVETLEVEPQGHENTGERQTRQFGFPGFGFGRPGFGFGRPGFGGGFGRPGFGGGFGRPGFGGGFGRPGFGGGFGRPGFGGGFGRPGFGGGFGGPGFGRTRIITRTRYVNPYGGFYG